MENTENSTVLILEDAQEVAVLYERYCQRAGIKYEIVSDGATAMQRIRGSERYAAFIVDLVLPSQDGKEFIRELKEMDPEAVIIVQTSMDSPERIIDVMKLGVFDYLIKPVPFSAFEKSIRSALQLDSKQVSQNRFERSSREVLRKQLEWLTYKESIRKSNEDSHLISTIRSLSTSLSQGSGIGAIVSLLDLLKMTGQETNEGKHVGNELLQLLYSNQEIIRKQLEGLSAILSIAEEEKREERISTVSLVQSFAKKVRSVEALLGRKKLKIRFSQFRIDEFLNMNRQRIEMAFQELLLNAIKYSKSGTFIDVYFSSTDGYFCFGVKNAIEGENAMIDSRLGEVLVTRPFYRILPPVEEYPELEQYGLGLGLTAVDLVVNKHRGLFHIYNVMDHTAGEVQSCVMAQIFLPLLDITKTSETNIGEGGIPGFDTVSPFLV